MRRRTMLGMTATAALTVAALATAPAQAAPADKAAVLASFTQTGAAGSTAWRAAHDDQARWSAYDFNWSTDYCSKSPDNPFGFPFKLSCARHDFGYRNYKAAGRFPANKPRLDSALYADLKRVCTAYSGAKKASCDATAWTYYQAVKALGN
ncbi:phospholipase [Streptomyces sp. NPDC059161]|uniref:phospholipase n=1 Tax=unclassified Streptomyces TaxID=2593676 RepID=UPI0036493882